MECKYCGKQLPEEAKFCLHCGQPVNSPEETPENNAAKLRRWIVIGIALVGVIILAAVIGGIKNYNQRNAAPTPEPEQTIEVFEQQELPEQQEPVLQEQPEEEFDPDSVVIPDLGEFFLKERFYERDHGDGGHKYTMINIPDTALEGVVEELFDLLSDPQYQLELDWEDSYYFEDEGTTSYYYYFTYTGSNPNIGEVYISEDKDPYTFQLTIYDMWAEDGIFDIGVFFNENFEEVKSGKHTQQDVGEQIEYADDPQPQNEKVKPDSVLLPDLEAFLYWSASTDKKYYDHGYQKGWNGSHPLAAYETVQQELLDLLAEERYQLELREMVENPHYGIPVYDFYYDYTGTSDSIVKLMDKYEEHDFDVCLSFFLTPEHNFFKISFKYSRGFQLEDPGTRTTRNMDPNSDGGVLVLPPTASDDSDWEHNSDLYNHTPPASKLKCLSCDGDGDCNTCGGSGYKRIGGAKAGCTTCRGNGKCHTCGGSGTR